MISDDLRKAIYLSAFKGKLSVRKEDDSSVDKSFNILLSLRNIDKKEIRKRKIDDDICPEYDIAPTWRWVKMGLLCDVIRGLTFSNSYSEKKDNNILVLRGGNIDSKSEKLIFNDNIYVDKNIPNSNQYLHVGDSLIVASSGTKTSVGKSTFIDKIDSDVSFGGFMMVVRPYSEIINPRYLSYNIKIYRNKIINNTNGYISNITNSILNNLLIPLPPIEEQQRIVDKIEELFAKLDEVKPIEEELKLIKNNFHSDMKKSIVKNALEGKLTIQNNNESTCNIIKTIEEVKGKKIKTQYDNVPFLIPNNWVWIKFNDLVNFDIGKTPPRADLTYWNNDYNWVSISDMIEDGFIDKTKECVSQKAYNNIFKGNISKKGTLIMSFKLTVGRCSLLNIDAFHNEGIISIYPIYESETLKKYLMKILPFMTKYGKTKGAIKGNTLNSKSLKELMIPLPPLEEQQRIIDKIEQLLPLCNDIEKLIKE